MKQYIIVFLKYSFRDWTKRPQHKAGRYFIPEIPILLLSLTARSSLFALGGLLSSKASMLHLSVK